MAIKDEEIPDDFFEADDPTDKPVVMSKASSGNVSKFSQFKRLKDQSSS